MVKRFGRGVLLLLPKSLSDEKCNEPDSKPMTYESSRQDLDALLEPRNVVTRLGKYHEGTEGKDGYGWEED